MAGYFLPESDAVAKAATVGNAFDEKPLFLQNLAKAQIRAGKLTGKTPEEMRSRRSDYIDTPIRATKDLIKVLTETEAPEEEISILNTHIEQMKRYGAQIDVKLLIAKEKPVTGSDFLRAFLIRDDARKEVTESQKVIDSENLDFSHNNKQKHLDTIETCVADLQEKLVDQNLRQALKADRLTRSSAERISQQRIELIDTPIERLKQVIDALTHVGTNADDLKPFQDHYDQMNRYQDQINARLLLEKDASEISLRDRNKIIETPLKKANADFALSRVFVDTGMEDPFLALKQRHAEAMRGYHEQLELKLLPDDHPVVIAARMGGLSPEQVRVVETSEILSNNTSPVTKATAEKPGTLSTDHPAAQALIAMGIPPSMATAPFNTIQGEEAPAAPSLKATKNEPTLDLFETEDEPAAPTARKGLFSSLKNAGYRIATAFSDALSNGVKTVKETFGRLLENEKVQSLLSGVAAAAIVGSAGAIALYDDQPVKATHTPTVQSEALDTTFQRVAYG
ncbi:MAG: hypothetical protein H6855_07640, partial [Rhodospirillales bacterium]|nr:hypothetical protein [Rhodospirillales bacterium]